MAMSEPADQPGVDGNDGSNEPANGTPRARSSASDAYENVRQRTGALYGSARERASFALETTRRGATRAKARTADGIDANPMAAVFGGLAIGAVVAALIPRTRQENAALGKLGGKINDGARAAAEAARNAGRDKLDELGLSSDGLRERFNEMSSTASNALRTTAGAAVGSIRTKDRK